MIGLPGARNPLVSADKVVCPQPHVDDAAAFLENCDGINLLVIGYSGLDGQMLRLFRDSGSAIRSMLVANGSTDWARDAAARIADAFGQDVDDAWLTNEGFSGLVSTGHLRGWMEGLKGR